MMRAQPQPSRGSLSVQRGGHSGRETRTYSPLRRVLALLHFLTAQYRDNRYAVFTEDELAVALAAHYEGGAAARTMRDDIGALKRRGLVVTNLRHPDHVRRRGVQRNGLVDKAEDLRLTADEHEALQDARRLLGNRLPSVSPTSGAPPAPGRENARVEDALLIVRLLEESPAGPLGSTTSRALSASARSRRRRWLSDVADRLGRERFVDVYSPDRDDVTDLEVRGIELRRYRVNGASHLLETGADLFGLFPYSEVEVMERLTLIADIRASGHSDEVDDRALCSVERKLELWLEHLRH